MRGEEGWPEGGGEEEAGGGACLGGWSLRELSLGFWNKDQWIKSKRKKSNLIVQELCESRGGRPGLPVLMSLVVSVDVK